MNIINDVYNWLQTSGNKHGDTTKLLLSLNLIDEELNELKEAIHANNRNEIQDACLDIFWTTLNCAFFYGLTMEEVQSYVNKVSISNWSKFCTSQDMAEVTVDLYKKGEHPDKLGQKIDCYYERVGPFWIVKRTDGKILKSLKYIKVEEL